MSLLNEVKTIAGTSKNLEQAREINGVVHVPILETEPNNRGYEKARVERELEKLISRGYIVAPGAWKVDLGDFDCYEVRKQGALVDVRSLSAEAQVRVDGHRRPMRANILGTHDCVSALGIDSFPVRIDTKNLGTANRADVDALVSQLARNGWTVDKVSDFYGDDYRATITPPSTPRMVKESVVNEFTEAREKTR